MRILAAGVSVTLSRSPILGDVDLDAPARQITGLIGPNGSGKSTLLRCIYRALKPTAGSVTLGDREVWSLSAKETGRRSAIVTQDHDLDNEYSVEEIVAMGRTPHKGLLDRDGERDRMIVAQALTRVGMSWSAARVFASLSGGERQRVLVARALAQQTPILLLDEPTNHLDIGAQLELLDLVRALGLTTIAALHDLDHAIAYCDRLVLLSGGRVVASGPPEQVLTPERVRDVFGVRSAVVSHPITGRRHLVTAPAAHAASGYGSG
jgi:iron complex transport system ATP-binding protein